MKRITWFWGTLTACTCTLAFALPASAQEKKDDKPKTDTRKDDKKPAGNAQDKKPDAKPAAGGAPQGEQDMAAMMAMMEKLAQPGENHKLLETMVGEWTFASKFWMDPSAPPNESTGTTSCKSILGGRFVQAEHKGKFPMPGPDGKTVEKDFHGIGVSGYDNIKKKFVNTWMDNFGTMIMMSEGTYDPGTKSFTYTAECSMMPDMPPTKIREVIKIIDKDKHTFEWFEDRGGTEVKTMEITYTRKKQ